MTGNKPNQIFRLMTRFRDIIRKKRGNIITLHDNEVFFLSSVNGRELRSFGYSQCECQASKHFPQEISIDFAHHYVFTDLSANIYYNKSQSIAYVKKRSENEIYVSILPASEEEKIFIRGGRRRCWCVEEWERNEFIFSPLFLAIVEIISHH